MLVHHFEAETQGFQGLVDQNDLAKALVPEQLHFPRETFFSGSSGVPNHSQRRPDAVQCKSSTIFFYRTILSCLEPEKCVEFILTM